jgi:hypothetical protein
MKTTLEQDAERFAVFLKEHYPEAKTWEDPVNYCAWYIGHGFIAAVCDERGEIVALGAARPVERPGMGVLPAYFNDKGTCLHIDILVDTLSDNRALIALREFTKVRWPQCKTMAMFRHFESHIRVHPIEKGWRWLERIKRKKKEKKQHEVSAMS